MGTKSKDNNIYHPEDYSKIIKARYKVNRRNGLVGWLFYDNGRGLEPVPFYGTKEAFYSATKKLRDKG